jgi:2-dehydro-3-deoxyphosphogalactonate aldolase
MNQILQKKFAEMPVIAIIRGVQPHEVIEIGDAIRRAGIGIIEVPLNSPQPFASIEKLATALGDQCVIGCGTLITKNDVARVADAGGKIAVTPNTRPAIIKRCIKHGLIPMPGWATPSEAIAAYQAGARYLKLFPAATYGAGHIKAVKAILAKDVKVLAVGGVGAAVAEQWLAAGADGFGIGSEIYKPGMSPEQVNLNAVQVVAAVKAARTVNKA